jgi:hypothetical protein
LQKLWKAFFIQHGIFQKAKIISISVSDPHIHITIGQYIGTALLDKRCGKELARYKNSKSMRKTRDWRLPV